jgi:hypothetical protein
MSVAPASMMRLLSHLTREARRSTDSLKAFSSGKSGAAGVLGGGLDGRKDRSEKPGPMAVSRREMMALRAG